MDEFSSKIDWENILLSQVLSESFIEKHLQKIEDYRVISSFTGNECWNIISCTQILSENFIRKYKDKVNWKYILQYQKLSDSFKKEFNLKISEVKL